MTVRDKLWLFASHAHDDDHYFRKKSRITPAEGALMLDVPNVIMVVSGDGTPAPFTADAYGYMESFSRMQNVFWTSTGSGGFRSGNEEAFICDLAARYPTVRGTYLDDFWGKFSGYEEPRKTEEALKMLKEIRAGLDRADRRLEMWITWYMRDLNAMSEEMKKYIDGIAVWTWDYRELPLLAERFEKIEANFPAQKKLLGIYICDYPGGGPVPDDMMELQCEFGLKKLQEGRIDGMVFLTNCVMGIGLSSDYWARNWIDKVKDLPLDEKK